MNASLYNDFLPNKIFKLFQSSHSINKLGSIVGLKLSRHGDEHSKTDGVLIEIRVNSSRMRFGVVETKR